MGLTSHSSSYVCNCLLTPTIYSILYHVLLRLSIPYFGGFKVCYDQISTSLTPENPHPSRVHHIFLPFIFIESNFFLTPSVSVFIFSYSVFLYISGPISQYSSFYCQQICVQSAMLLILSHGIVISPCRFAMLSAVGIIS